MASSNNNTIIGCDSYSNDRCGIYLESSNDNTLEDNNASSSNLSNGITLWSSDENKLCNNTANVNNNYGIDLSYSSNNAITNNNALDNYCGIHLESSSTNNIITANTIAYNNKGIHLYDSGNNLLYHNNFITNTLQAYDYNGSNDWDNGATIGGNYWSDHKCTGNPSNGSQPYTKIDTNAGAVDHYPFEDYCGGNPFRTVYVPDDYESIQDAVNAANLGDTVIVRDGTYTENVNIGKILSIRSENGTATTTIQASNSDDDVFYVGRDYVTINGFTVKGATGSKMAGIYLTYTKHCNISGNNVLDNDYGIRLCSSSYNNLTNNTANSNNIDGIYLSSSSYNNISNNTANSNNNYGIYLSSSSNNTITNNTANSNNNYGIRLSSSSNNTLTDNVMSGNAYNFGVYGGYIQSIDTSNKVDGKTIYYWVNQRDKEIPSDAGFVGVVNSTNITVRDLALTKNGYGVLFAYTENSRIENINASNNNYGIYLYSSSNNTIIGCDSYSNDRCGIYLESSNNNTLNDNNASSSKYSYGIHLSSSSNNTLTDNVMSGNAYNFGVYDGYIQNIDTSNKVDGKPVYYWVNQRDKVIPSDAGFVGVVNSTNITVRDLALTKNGYGVLFAYTENSRIENINASNNYYGIYLNSSSNNTLTNNTANSNNGDGIDLDESSNNTITNNTASNNGDGIDLDESSNNTITNNTASNNYYGIRLHSSSNINTITKNNAYPNRMGGIQIDETSGKNRIYMNNFKFNISVPQIEFNPYVWVEYPYWPALTTAIVHCEFENEGGPGAVTIYVSDSTGYPLYDTDTFYVSSYGYYHFEIFMPLRYSYIFPKTTALEVSSPSATSPLYFGLEGEAYLGVFITPPAKNFLNSAEEINYTYKGNTYTNYLGSYWSNYEERYPNAAEIGSTGIWDTPCRIVGEDNYPLVEPWENYFPGENQLPIANFTYSPPNPIVNQTITFNASSSYDPDGIITGYEWSFGDGTNGIGKIVTHSYSSAGDYTVNLTVTDDDGATNTTSKVIKVYPKVSFFDTGPGTYPSIFGTHNGTITPNQDITVQKMYTYPCVGTGGHTESIKLYENGELIASGTWNGYQGDWHNITFDSPFILEAGKTYNYTLRTGSYPQIHHTDRLVTDNGIITCTEFLDANGKVYYDWIPAIRLE